MAYKEKHEVMVIAISIFLAFILWIYVMSDTNPYKTKVIYDIPVKLVNVDSLSQSNLAMVPGQKFTVNLTVTGRTLTINNISALDFDVEADLSGYPLRKGDNKIPYEVKVKPDGVEIDSRHEYPVISVKLDNLLEKAVPVSVNVTGNVEGGYGYIQPKVRPQEVMISGAESIVNSVTSVSGTIDISNKSSDVISSVALQAKGSDGSTIKDVTIDPKNVDVDVAVKPAKTVPVVVTTTGKLPTNESLSSMKPHVDKVVIIGDSKYLNSINEIDTTPVDLSTVTASTTKEVSLKIPNGVFVIGNIGSINVDVSVENIINKTVSVPVTIQNQQNGFNYVLSTNNVSVTLSGLESVINAMDPTQLTAVVDVTGLAEGDHDVNVNITPPANISVGNYSPQKVTVTVTKK